MADGFEAHRERLRGVAYRMLGSVFEADDAVQETWLRYSRTDTSGVANLGGWLTTVLSRVCLDLLRSRGSRREEPLTDEPGESPDPASEVELADAVGRALLVVLETLAPAERVAFVLHDALAVPFAEIAPILGRTPEATKKLAGRARHKVRGEKLPSPTAGHRVVIDRFLGAIRNGDVPGLLEVLAPDVVRRADPALLAPGAPVELRGARAVAEEAKLLSRERARYAEPALVNGSPGVVVAPRGRLEIALLCTIEGGRITAYEVVADPARVVSVALLP
ncbi:RNA polymerase sigma-70 factor (ECF subfamily) [Amycolatopsis bartoniae]|uniref:DNA-directed RNA polymerase sigma-70 factor n=1 Tax=Amycolatopsis bartoniae TaxID=941986 RepID=A0A8H9MFW5_9PSEU|nr:sigma-70 family RNA polymerase sigma factor [Amycolatopsis bartoniae]MBB2935229.1 RNA polymerase sigma-70 factor (ECF subfamily) [Amycolatopsis bartoniae]TVT04063.1 sigma-70 family RNA polymerase sigma factor [Amycolatopsis bartoniae]GHF75250.1 DNA-directed RNA polymerase sigma-70 factor [Amycolatopsis bartoniae]